MFKNLQMQNKELQAETKDDNQNAPQCTREMKAVPIDKYAKSPRMDLKVLGSIKAVLQNPMLYVSGGKEFKTYYLIIN